MSARVVVLLLALAWAMPAAGAGDPLREGIARLRIAIAQLGAPQAGEVASERAELASTLAKLASRAQTLDGWRRRADSEQQSLDMLNRDREDRLRQVDLDQRVVEEEVKDFERRSERMRAEVAAQHAAVAAATTKAAMAAANAWADEGNPRIRAMFQEGSRLNERKAAIESRRNAIAAEFAEHAARAERLARYRAEIEYEAAPALAECSAALSKALALKQIANSPARAPVYEPPGALGEKVLTDFFSGMAKESALRGLEGKTMVRLLAKVGLKAQAVGLAFTAADTFADVALAGVDQRTRKITENLFLIGDYGAVMKAMVKAQGAPATQAPEYLAMRGELERIAADMPTNKREMLWQGLTNSAALGAALVAAAGTYLSKPVGLAGSKITNHLSKLERATLGPGGVKFFTHAFQDLGSVGTDIIVKSSAEAIAAQTESVREARSKR